MLTAVLFNYGGGVLYGMCAVFITNQNTCVLISDEYGTQYFRYHVLIRTKASSSLLPLFPSVGTIKCPYQTEHGELQADCPCCEYWKHTLTCSDERCSLGQFECSSGLKLARVTCSRLVFNKWR